MKRDPTYTGPERRCVDRAPLPAPRVTGRARVSASFPYTRTAPLARGRWFPLVDGNPAVGRPPLEGYVWIDADGPLRHIRAAFLEIEREG